MTENIKISAHSVVILAAGLSERMGFLKPLLKFDEFDNFLSHIVSEYEKIAIPEIIVVTNEAVRVAIGEKKIGNAKIIINKNPGLGRFGSIKIGLNEVKKKNACFICNADNPFINTALLIKMASKVKEENYIVPEFEGKGGHPILMGCKVMEAICKQKQNDVDLREVLRPFERMNITTDDERILYNINTKEDYNYYFRK